MLPSQPNPLTEKLLVETPEQVHLEFAVAGVGSRFLAILVDTLIQAGTALVAFIILAILGATGLLRSARLVSLWLLAGLVFFLFFLNFGYFALFEIFWNGQTPGKRAVGLRVIKDTGRPLAISESLARNLMRIVDQLPTAYAVGVIVAMCNLKTKRLGDYVAGSIVIREKRLEEIARPWTVAPVLGTALGGRPLTPEDLALVDTFLIRRLDLDPGVRYRMARQILSRLESKVSLPEDYRERPESALELLAHEQRSL